MESILEKLSKTPERRGSKKMKFLALKNQIEEALEGGYSVMAIWELLRTENQLDMTYQHFTFCVRSYIRKKTIEQPSREYTEKKQANNLKNKTSTKKIFYHPDTPPPDKELF
ncbi:MAG: TraK family protein [Endozoicomonas sp. (ex Botrylloides leachii)]|nr:TraK family protein [Endozoicomonas sp. (ex Botrylloides leachii)]